MSSSLNPLSTPESDLSFFRLLVGASTARISGLEASGAEARGLSCSAARGIFPDGDQTRTLCNGRQIQGSPVPSFLYFFPFR